MNKFIIFIFFFNLLCFKSFSQQFTIVGPQNDCAKGISKNVHTDSKDFVIDGYAKLKITTQQHRFFDNSKIYDAINGNLIWEWKGESFNDTWYKKEHTIEINAKKIRVEFTQGYRDPFCNGFIKVEKISSDNQSTSQNIIEYNDLKIISVQNYKSALGRLEGKIINGTINNIDQESFIRHDYGNQQIEISTKYDHYKGGYINNKKNGSGIYESKGNFIYEGQFKDNEITGNGLMIYYTTDDTYEGGLVKGNRNGKGIYKWKTGSSSGRTYNGDWENGKMHGYGLLTNPDGSKLYEGAFYKGEYHGFGVLYSANNSKTGGIWQTGNLLHSLPAFVNNPKFYDFDIEYGYTSFVNDVFHVSFNSKKGVINIKGKEIIPTKYDVLEGEGEGKGKRIIGRIFSSDAQDVYDYNGNFLGTKSHNADIEQANRQREIAINKMKNQEKQLSSSNNQTINRNLKNEDCSVIVKEYEKFVNEFSNYCSAVKTGKKTPNVTEYLNWDRKIRFMNDVVLNCSDGIYNKRITTSMLRLQSSAKIIFQSSPKSNNSNNTVSSNSNNKPKSTSVSSQNNSQNSSKREKEKEDFDNRPGQGHEAVRQSANCKHCGNTIFVQRNVPISPKIRSTFNEMGGITGICNKCSKMTSFTYEINKGKFIKLERTD